MTPLVPNGLFRDHHVFIAQKGLYGIMTNIQVLKLKWWENINCISKNAQKLIVADPIKRFGNFHPPNKSHYHDQISATMHTIVTLPMKWNTLGGNHHRLNGTMCFAGRKQSTKFGGNGQLSVNKSHSQRKNLNLIRYYPSTSLPDEIIYTILFIIIIHSFIHVCEYIYVSSIAKISF